MGKRNNGDNGQQGKFDFDQPPSLIQPELTRAVTNEAIARAVFLTNDERKQIYFEGIENAARHNAYFCCDQIWDALGQVGDDERDDGSGMGPVIRKALTARVMEPTGTFQRSQRPKTHGKPLPTYKSLLGNGPAIAIPIPVPVRKRAAKAAVSIPKEEKQSCG